MKACTLYIVRHGQSTHNRDYVTSGHVDPQLTETGIAQAETTKAKLADIAFDDVYSSDLQRAVHTATIIYGKPVPENHQLSSLRERNFGEYDGKPEELLDKLADSTRQIFNTLPNDQQWKFKYAPDIESDYELSTRFIRTLEEIAANNIGKTILVASHGGAIRTMLIALQRLNTGDVPRGSIENTGFVELVYDGSALKVERISGVKRVVEKAMTKG